MMNKYGNISEDMDVIDLGFKSFQSVWSLQKILQDRLLKKEINEKLLIVEHEPVYTLGKNANRNHLLQSRNNSIHVYNTERGGDITFHGPGQIVVYPILNLSNYRKSLSWYMRMLEQVSIDVLSEFSIIAKRVNGMTGVWVNDEKISAQGVRVSRWVTMHGFSLNVNTDLSFYDGIIPCGIFNYGITSMEKILGEIQSIEKVKNVIIDKFMILFEKN